MGGVVESGGRCMCNFLFIFLYSMDEIELGSLHSLLLCRHG